MRLAFRRARPARTEPWAAAGLKKEEVPWAVREIITAVREKGMMQTRVGRRGERCGCVVRSRGRRR